MSERNILPNRMGNVLHPAQSYCSLGQALAKQGRWQEAIAAYSQALALNPNLEEARQGWEEARIQQLERPSTNGKASSNGVAEEDLPSIVTSHQFSIKTYLKQARDDAARQDWQSAIDRCHQVLQRYPDAAEAYGLLEDVLS